MNQHLASLAAANLVKRHLLRRTSIYSKIAVGFVNTDVKICDVKRTLRVLKRFKPSLDGLDRGHRTTKYESNRRVDSPPLYFLIKIGNARNLVLQEKYLFPLNRGWFFR